MKCTKEQYESIKEYVGDLQRKHPGDFKEFNYLTFYKGKSYMYRNQFLNTEVYETFDKDVLLKACGIDPNAALFNKVREHFKDAEDCVSLLGGTFKMSEYDLNNLEKVADLVYTKKKTSGAQRRIYNIATGHFAAILPKVSTADGAQKPKQVVTYDDFIKKGTWKVNPGVEPVRLTRKQIEAILGYEINIIND